MFDIGFKKNEIFIEWSGKFKNFSSLRDCLPCGSLENQNDNDFREKIKKDNGGKLDDDTINYILEKKKISLLKKIVLYFLPRLRNEPSFSIIRRKLENEKASRIQLHSETFTIKNSSKKIKKKFKTKTFIDNYVSNDDVNKEIDSLMGALLDPNITKEKVTEIFKYLRKVMNIKINEMNPVNDLDEDEKIILNNFMNKLREIFFYNIRAFNSSSSSEFLPTPINEPIIELYGSNRIKVKCNLNVPIVSSNLSPEEKNKLNNLIKNLIDQTSLLVAMFISFGTSVMSAIIWIVLYFWKKINNSVASGIFFISLIIDLLLVSSYFTNKNSGSRSLHFTKDNT